MAKNNERERWKNIVKAVARLIKARSPDISLDKLSKEVHLLSSILQTAVMNFEFSKRQPKDNYSRKNLIRISALTKKLSKELSNPAIELMLDLILDGGLKTGELSNIEAQLQRLSAASVKASQNKKKQGRARDFSKETFCEKFIQVYEIACGVSLKRIRDKKSDIYRRHMTALFELMLAAIQIRAHIQNEVALKKFVREYIKMGRPDREEVAEEIASELKAGA